MPRRPKVAESVKQPVLIAVKVPASPTSDTKPARKLLDAIGHRPTTKQQKRTARAKAKGKPASRARASAKSKSRAKSTSRARSTSRTKSKRKR